MFRDSDEFLVNDIFGVFHGSCGFIYFIFVWVFASNITIFGQNNLQNMGYVYGK